MVTSSYATSLSIRQTIRFGLSLCFASGLLVATGATAKATTLFAAGPYNAFVFGGFTETGSDDGGRLAAGGNASFNGYYSISQALLDSATAPNNDSLVVGGQITSGVANMYGGGNAYVGTTGGGGTVQFNNGGSLTTGSPSPIDFAGAQTMLTNYSAFLATLSATAPVNTSFSTVTLAGSDPSLNVFTLDGSLLGGSNTIDINVPNGSTVLINVTGTNITTTNAGIFINGSGVSGNSTNSEVDHILFNFSQATSLTLNGGFLGSVLAPNAAVIGNNYQQIDGQLIAASFTGSTEFHDFLFNGNLPTATPEPGTFAMLGAGAALLVFARSRSMRKH